MALGYLLEPFIQIQNVNGTPIVGAKIYVYNADTTNLATTYNDFEGHLNTNPVITNDLGNATIIADDGIEYDVSVYDANDLLLFTKKYISIDKTSSAGGTTQVTAGYGISVEKVGNTFIVSVDTDLIATKDDLAEKQDKLHGGDNIEITDDNEVNVVGRRELIVERPLRVDRTNNRLKLYFEDDFSDYYKTKQAAVNYGGSPNTYISYIQQNENGEIEATVSNVASLPIAAELIGGDNISLTYNDNNIIIAGRDWTPELNTKVDTSATTGWDITPYTAGSNISIVNHTIVGKNWSTDISNAVAPKLDTSVFSAYSATTDNAISTIANDLSDFSASTTGWDVSPYYAGIDLVKNGHTIGVDTDSRILAGSYNFVAGHSNTANGGSNGAFGQYNTAIGAKNFAVCNFNSIHGNDNFVANTNNSISGDKNIAAGENNTVTGNNNTIFGSANSATGNSNFLIGNGLTSNGNHVKIGNTNCYIDVDYTNKKLYKSIDGVLTDLDTTYTGGTGITVSNNQISCNGDITPYTGSKYITVSNHQISLSNSFVAVYRLPKSASCNKDGTRYTIFSQAPGIGIADTYTFSTLYNASTQKYELELSNDNSRIFSVYIDGVFVDYVGALRKKIYETADTMKPIKIELVGAGVGNRTPLYKFTVIFVEYSPGYMVSLYIEYDYNFAINV